MKYFFISLICLSSPVNVFAFCGTGKCSYSKVIVNSCTTSKELSEKIAMELNYDESDLKMVRFKSQFTSLVNVTVLNDVEVIFWYRNGFRNYFKGKETPFKKNTNKEFMVFHDIDSCKKRFLNKEMFVTIADNFSCHRDVVLNNEKETRPQCLINLNPMYRFEREYEDLQDIGIPFPKKQLGY